MEFNSKLFFSALGLAFILEALPYTLFPERMRQVLQTLGEEGASGLRRMGLFSLRRAHRTLAHAWVVLWGRSSALFRQAGGALMEPEYVSFACSLGTEKPLNRDCIQGLSLR